MHIRLRLRQPTSSTTKIFFVHPIERGSDEIAIWFEKTRWDPGLLGFDSSCTMRQKSRVIRRVAARNGV